MAAEHIKRKVLITGATGLLGRELYKAFKGEGWNVLGLAYSRAKGELIKVDLKDTPAVTKVFDNFKPDIVVHSAAERRPDKMGEDLEGSRMLNVSSTEAITKLCSEHDCFLIYMSTDYVFDGHSPPYRPGDKTNPLNAYGVSKRDGEVAVQTYSNSAILRVPVLYGPIEAIDESAVTIIYNAVKTGKPVKLSDYEIRFPTHTRDVAKAVVQISSSSLRNRPFCCRIWHFSANGNYTKYGMACAIGRRLGVSVGHIEPVRGPSGGAPRPFNTQLHSTETFEAFNCRPSFVFEDAIEEVLKPFHQV